MAVVFDVRGGWRRLRDSESGFGIWKSSSTLASDKMQTGIRPLSRFYCLKTQLVKAAGNTEDYLAYQGSAGEDNIDGEKLCSSILRKQPNLQDGV